MELNKTTYAVIGAAIFGTMAYGVMHFTKANKNLVILVTLAGAGLGSYIMANADGSNSPATGAAAVATK